MYDRLYAQERVVAARSVRREESALLSWIDDMVRESVLSEDQARLARQSIRSDAESDRRAIYGV